MDLTQRRRDAEEDGFNAEARKRRKEDAMKRVMMMVAVVLMGSAALAAQIVVVVRCRDGQADTGALQAKLKDGWRVVNAVPVQDSNSNSLVGKPRQAYTASIVYVLEKD